MVAARVVGLAGIGSLLQRAAYAWRRYLSPDYARGVRWCEAGLRLDRELRQARELQRLERLIAGFGQRGFCDAPALRRFSVAAGVAGLRWLPVMTKRDLRRLWPQLNNVLLARPDVYSYSTGGSTGEPVKFLRSQLQDRLAGGAEYAMHQILGWRPGMARLCLWGSERDIDRAEHESRGLRGWLQDTTIFGAFAPGEAEYQQFAEAVWERPGCAVYGFTSLLVECARVMLERGWELGPGHVAAAWVGAESLADAQREVFREAFGVPLRDHYGSRECSSVAAECAQGCRHINPRYIVEVADPETHEALPAGETGSLLVTDLFNDVTPLIRYEIGDIGAIEWRDCDCGRRGPCLTELAGRVAALFTLPSGKKVSALFFNHLLKEYPVVHQFQVLRTGADQFDLRYRGGELEAQTRQRLTEVVSRLLEGARVTLTKVDELDRGPSGKLIQYRDLTAGH